MKMEEEKMDKLTLQEVHGKEEPEVEDEGDEGEEDGEADAADANGDGVAKKKPKKKKPKKKKKKVGASGPAREQTDPPRIPVRELFPKGFNEGQVVEYRDQNSYRTTSEEKRAAERLLQETDSHYNDLRRAAEVHRQVRKWARGWIKPGVKMFDIAQGIEDGVRALVEEDGMDAGIAFPTGLSRNHVAAHYSPNAGDESVLEQGDVLKVDFGVHVNGKIIDSAFTLCFEDKYQPLLDAVRAATNEGIKAAGIDVRVGDIGAAIQEVMESHEIELDGKTHPSELAEYGRDRH